MKRREAGGDYLIEGAFDKLAYWCGLGAAGVGLVTIIMGLLTWNHHLLAAGTLASGAGLQGIRTGLRSKQSQNENQTTMPADPKEAIASNPAVQREAGKLGLSHEQLVSVIEKIRRFVSRFGAR